LDETVIVNSRICFGKSNFTLSAKCGTAQQSKVHFPGFGNVSSNHTGINIGGGAIFPLSDNMGVNAQLKYQSNIEQFAINGGLLFSF